VSTGPICELEVIAWDEMEVGIAVEDEASVAGAEVTGTL